VGSEMCIRDSLIQLRGHISFCEMAHNQLFVVRLQLSSDLQHYLFKRKALMQQIEDRDIRQQREKDPSQP